MAEQFNIDAKLVIAGVEVKGDLNAGKLKFDIDTAPLKKLVADATDAARKVKAKFDGIKFNKIKLELNQSSLRAMKTQIRKTIQEAVNGIQLGKIGVGQQGPAGQLSRVSRATQATQAAERKGTFKDPVTGKFQKAADAISHSAEALKQVLQGAGAQIRPNVEKKPLTAAQIKKGNKERVQRAQEPDDLKRVVAKEKALRAKQHSEDKIARSQRAAAIKKQIAEERALKASNHTKTLAEIDARTAREIKAMQRVKSARAKGGPAAGSPTGPGTGRGRVSDFGGGGGGGGGRGGVGAGASPGGPGRGAGGVNALTAALGEMTSKTKGASKEMDNLEELTFLVGKKAAAFRGVAIAINTIVTSAQAAAKFMIEFNDSLKEVNKILQLSDQVLSKMGDDLIALSSNTGVAIDQTVGISEAFARAGLDGRGYGSVVELTSRALTGMQGTTLEAAQATELFIQIIQQVEGGARGLNKELVTTTKLFDVLGKAEDITASKATDVQAAFKRSAASVLATGASIEEATTLISVLQERTQRGGDVIGTALKTMAARISSSTSEATKALNSIGVATIDAQGNLRNLFDVLQDASIAFQGLTEAEQANIAVKAAGIRQVEIFRSAVRDFGRMQEVNNALQNASGDAARKQAVEQTKLVVSINKITIAFQNLINTASKGILGDVFVGAIKVVQNVTQAVADFDKKMGGAISTTIGIGAAIIGFKVILPMLFGIGRAIKFFIGSQQRVVAEMGKITKGAGVAATTIETKMLTSINRSTTATRALRMEMEGVAAASMTAARSAGGITPAGRGPGMFGGGGPGERGNQQGGGAIVAPGARVLPQTVVGGVSPTRRGSKLMGGLNKQMGRGKRAFGKFFNNIGVLSIATAGLGFAMNAAAEKVRAGGNESAASALETTGSVLAGAGQGALIGSFFGPIGTAIGAIAGGALPLFTAVMSETEKQTDALAQSMLKLGIIQSKNGQLTSDAAKKVEEAVRNIDAANSLAIGFEARQRAGSRDPATAKRNTAEETKAFELAGKSLLVNLKPNESVERQRTASLQALSRSLEAVTGQEGLDLSSPIFAKGGIGGEGLTSKDIQVLIDTFARQLEATGQDPTGFRKAAEAELEVGELTKIAPVLIKMEQEKVDIQRKALQENIKAILPQQEGVKRDVAQKAFLDTLQKLESGQIAITDAAVSKAIGFAEKTGFKDEAGKTVRGAKGRQQAQELANDAAAVFADQARVLTAGLSTAGSAILKLVVETDRLNVAFQKTNMSVETINKRLAESVSAFADVDATPGGDIVGGPINELQFALRTFIQDFGREVIKLSESRIRASTPQVELAQRLADNSRAVLDAAEQTAKAERALLDQRTKRDVGKIGAREDLLSASPDALRAKFSSLRLGGEQGIEDKIREKFGPKADIQLELDKLLKGGDKGAIAEILGVIRGKGTAQGRAQAAFPEIPEVPGIVDINAQKGQSLGDLLKPGAFKAAEAERDKLVALRDQEVADRAKQVEELSKSISDTEAGADKFLNSIIKFGTVTQGDAIDSFINNAIKGMEEALKKGIDPTVFIKGLKDSNPEFLRLQEKQKEATIKVLVATGKELAAIDKRNLDKRLRSNAQALAALKARISEERRVLAIDKGRREASALNARAMAEELTGIRRLVAERQIAKRLSDAEIRDSQKVLSVITEEIAKVQAKPPTDDKKEQTSRTDQLADLEKERAKVEIAISKKVGKQRISDMRDILKAAKEASDEGKRVAQNERGRIGTLADIGKLLSLDQSAMAGFNAELATLGANFKVSQAEVAAAAEAANKIENPEEREKQLALARQSGIDVALQMAKAEAQIEAKRRSAIKQIVGQLLANQQSQVTAQKKVIDTTKALSDAYESYLQAVDGVVLATTQYNLALSLANVAARKTTGGFTGIREELTAVQTAFSEAERMAAEMGASEKTLVEIRRQSIDQQLALFNQLLSQQTSAARSFFTSSAQDQADLVRGLGEAGGIADLLGGSFDAFKGKADAGGLNDLGSKILALPQDMRKRIQEAIDTLKVTGGTIGGFTAEELEAAINSAVLGESAELKVDPLFEVQERIANLQQEQAKIATEQLIAANEAMQDAKKGVELAEEQKALAEIALERVKEEGEKLRSKLGELRGTLNTTLLSQVQATKQGLKGVMNAVERAATRMITELPASFNIAIGAAIDLSNRKAEEGGITRSDSNATPPSASKQAADSRNQSGRNKSVDRFASGAAGVDANQPSVPQQVSSNNPQDPNVRTLSSILDQLIALNKTGTANLSVTQEIKNDQDKRIGTAAATVTGGGEVEITVNVNGTSQVTVTGFEAGVTRLAQALAETMGGFTTEDEARRIANEVIENIRKALLEKQIITANTQ